MSASAQLAVAVETENGAPAYLLDPWNDLLAKTFPDTPAQDIKDGFRPLYEEDRCKAFKYAMMFGNLRKGGGGRANMKAFVTCMDVVWEKNPMHIVANVRIIMELCSAKMMLVRTQFHGRAGVPPKH